MNRLLLIVVILVASCVGMIAGTALAQTDIIDPVADQFIEKGGVYGSIAVIEAMVIAFLFRLVMKSYERDRTERITEMRELTKIVTTNTSVLERIEMGLAKRH